jgi:molecular chaperone IbpA
MVNTALTLDPSRVRTYSIGFDRMFDRLFDDALQTTSNYPPYNIVKTGEDKYAIEIAVAGFSRDDIEIETKENILTIRSIEKKEEVVDAIKYLHKGISNRAFKRSFTLSDDVVITGADLTNGMLYIEMERIIPEEKKPRLIAIK